MNITPLERPPDATVAVPGSKSLTNRALLCAALAEGPTELIGALSADDTDAMGACLDAALAGKHELDARRSGTTARFLIPVLATLDGTFRLDGHPQLRARPMGALLGAVKGLGANITELGEPGHLPVQINGRPLAGGHVSIPGHVTSQFVSALLLAGPRFERGLQLDIDGDLVSAPYVEMTRRVMRDFGADVDGLRVRPGSYRSPGQYRIEPDASSASYFFAAAAITGGRVTVEGLGRDSLQGDLRLVEVLREMGAEVEQSTTATTVVGSGGLHGGEFDLASMPDMAQTLAVVAVFADSPTTVTGVAVIRGHETDRITAVVTELRRAGIQAEERPDGFVVQPGTPRPARIETYDDHRMAMAFALLGLRVPGIEIADAGCVAKTYPGYFEALDQLR